MARLTTGFQYQPIIAPYAPPPVEEFREALDERSAVYDRNIGEMDKLDILANNIDVLDPDREIKLAEIDKIRNSLTQVGEVGAENATNLVRAAARDFASNQRLRGASEKFALEQQRQEDLRQLRLKGITPYDFTSEYGGIDADPDWRPTIESANDVLTDAKKYVGTIKDKFRDLGWNIIQKTDPDGVKYTVAVTGEGQEVSRQMIEERIGNVIDEFMQSPTGGNQYVRWNEFNGQNGRDAAYEMLKTAALEQEGERTQLKRTVLRTDDSALSGGVQHAPEGIKWLPSSEAQRLDENFDIKELSTFDKFIQTLRASDIKIDTENPMIDPLTKVPMFGIVPGEKVSNEFARERLEPYTQSALSYLYPNATSSEIQEMVDNAFSQKEFILDQPEVKRGLEQYYEAIKDYQSIPAIIDPNIGATATREYDKKFTAENIEKEIKSTFKQRRYKTTINGKVVDVTDDVLKILNNDPNTFDVAGIYDIMNHFIEPDPDTQIDGRDPSGQMFAQPYAINLRIPEKYKGEKFNTLQVGKPFEIAVSRDFGNIVGRDDNKEAYQTAAIIHNQAIRNIGRFVELDNSQLPYLVQSIGNVPAKVRAMIDPSGNTVYEFESDAVLRYGPRSKSIHIRTNPHDKPENALAAFMMTVLEKREKLREQ